MEWPAHEHRTVGWSQSRRAGTRADRILREVVVSLPPVIAELPTGAPAIDELAVTASIGRLDERAHAGSLGALGTMMIRLESVASSKIEHLEASARDFARALAGSRANSSATAMVAASNAIRDLIDSVSGGGLITREALLRAHAELMADDPAERDVAGRFRTMQNWIGGSDYSPRDALYVPPPPETVDDYIDDLLAFSNRDDPPPVTQAAIAHAQFESIHPFTDGNGRIGRALIQAILRRRGVSHAVVVPIASALVADRERYFSLLTEYRSGDVRPIVDGIVSASGLAVAACLPLPERLAALPAEWRELSGARRSSTADLLIDRLVADPVVTAASIETILGVGYTAANGAIASLVDAGVLSPLNDRKRDRAFVAADVLAELESLEREIRDAARRSRAD
ncbi:Fic family protein [Herbiconiux sp. KACC 21604]|uniref:Fic family protein n=1 Tax=unclassified Herbiconiux TaxID=2618217 RepID=UPI001492EF32|nr:Fic family protein [Herbiconiux sp. SALV-R1]QJU55272.1 Fic family protein [Herbiconiux sp. SALV-R1]WPO86439.1 Fic family protein [Herbiconiux sp. KACC 21604]